MMVLPNGAVQSARPSARGFTLQVAFLFAGEIPATQQSIRLNQPPSEPFVAVGAGNLIDSFCDVAMQLPQSQFDHGNALNGDALFAIRPCLRRLMVTVTANRWTNPQQLL